jgi:predicted lipid-binding transport protein (Tim44 family)
VDRELDQFIEEHPGFTHTIDNLMIPGFDQKLDAVLSDLDKEAAADQAMLAEFAKLPDAEAPGVSVTALSDADKTFDDHEVVSVVRDCCLILQKARLYEQADLGEAELSPELEAELRKAIARDVDLHHHHLLPGLEIDDAGIVKALLVDGKEVVTVRLWLRAEQLVRDDATEEIIEGSTDVITWQEDWTLTRDPRVSDTSGEDETLTLSGQWFIAHKGWVVTTIERLTDSLAGPSSLLT